MEDENWRPGSAILVRGAICDVELLKLRLEHKADVYEILSQVFGSVDRLGCWLRCCMCDALIFDVVVSTTE